MTEHDNTNHGACWTRRAFGGKLNIGGDDFYVDLVETGLTGEKAPAYRLYLRSAETHVAAVCGIWRDTTEAKRVASGSIITEKGEWWVSVFHNGAPEGNKPIIGLQVQPKEMAGAGAQGEAPPSGDEIPF